MPDTAYGYLKFMTEGSLLLRVIVGTIVKNDRFLKPRTDGKLLILENTPLIAMFIAWAMNMMGVNAALSHSGLSNAERNDLQIAFCDKESDIDVMVCMYEAGGVGRNFHVDCHEFPLSSPGKRQATET